MTRATARAAPRETPPDMTRTTQPAREADTRMVARDADGGPVCAMPGCGLPPPPPPRPGPVSLKLAGAETLAWMHRRAARQEHRS
jgi:hypothetical protein